MLRSWGGIAIAALLLAPAAGAWGETRVALVIGNDEYSQLPDLNNAGRDARGLAAKLEELGFDTTLALNLRRRDWYDALDEFQAALRSSDVGLLYYAGHGVQLEDRNYFIPSDAVLEREADLRADAIPMGVILDTMQRSGGGLNIVIVDACRDNPLPVRSRSALRGLALEVAPAGLTNSVIVYSASPGEAAEDGPPGGNSVFAAELLRALDEPGLVLEQVFKRVIEGVGRRTNGRQLPRTDNSLIDDFYFNLGAPRPAAAVGPAAPVRQPADHEQAFWNDMKGSENPADFRAYLTKYPNGSFAPLAYVRLGQLDEDALALNATERRLIVLGLTAEGYDAGAADGTFGKRARAAVRSWQAVRGDPETGYVDAGALSALVALGLGPLVEEALGLSRAQRRLIEAGLDGAGYDPGPVDGVFTQRTRGAVSSWQAARGEAETGYLDTAAANELAALGTSGAAQGR